MIQGIITHLYDNHKLEDTEVGVKDLVTPSINHGALPYLCPHLKMAETASLPEVAQQVDKAKLFQYVINELAVRVLGLIQVHIEVYHQYQVLALGSFQGLLEIKEASQHGWWEVHSDDRGPGCASDNLIACHVCPMEER